MIVERKPVAGIDIIGHGKGYVLVPPSIHPHGGEYRWVKGRALGEVAMAPAPSWLPSLVSARKAAPQSQANGHEVESEDLEVRIEKYGSPNGRQWDDIGSLVGRYINRGFSDDKVIEIVWGIVEKHFVNFRPRERWTKAHIEKDVHRIRARDNDQKSKASARGVVASDDLINCNETPQKRWKRGTEIMRKKLKWLWEGQLSEGYLALWAGDPGTGKSAIALDIAARITRGDRFPDEPEGTKHEPRNVIIISFEDFEDVTIKPRLEAAGADMSRVFIFPLEDAPSITQEVPVILDALNEIQPALVIFDPLSSGMTGDVDSHKNTAVRAALKPLIAALKTTRTAALAIEHLNKNEKGNRAFYRLNGSVAFGAMARFVSIAGPDPLRRDDEHAHVLAPTKQNLCGKRGALRYSTVSTSLPRRTPRKPSSTW